MKNLLLITMLLTAALLAGGCGQDEIAAPGATAEADKAGAADLPAFTTLGWPAPDFIPSIFRVDHKSGAGTILAPLDLEPAPPGWPGPYAGFATPYGIAFDVDGTAYSLHNWFDGVEANCFSQLIRMDLATGATTPIGPVHDINFAGPEFDAYGNLWATGFTVGPPEGGPIYVWGNSNLYRFDKATGEKTLIGDTGHTEWMDLDFDSQGRLWATFANDLYLLDTETGASTLVTHVDGIEDVPFPMVCEMDWPYMEIMGMAFDHRDVLWGTAMKGFSICEQADAPVFTIDIAAGVAHYVGSTTLNAASHGGDIPPRKVNICHRTGHGGFVPLSVDLAALAAHLDHGDHLTTSANLECHAGTGKRPVAMGD